MKKNFAPARHLALQTILAAEKGQTLQSCLDSALAQSSLALKDKRLCADLAYGYFRCRERLNFILAKILAKPQKLPQAMQVVLGMAVYAMLFQSRVPVYAAASEAVAHIKKLFGQKMACVANGALRSLAALFPDLHKENFYIQETGSDWLGKTLFYSMPLSIADLWRDAYGEETALTLLRRSFQRPWTGIRLNAAKEKMESLKAQLAALESGPHSDKIARIGAYGYAFAPGFLPAFMQAQENERYEMGAFSFQSAGSLLVMEELGLFNWQKPVWDCCAGIGGKSAALAERGLKVEFASDINQNRLETLPKFFKRLGLRLPALAKADASQPPLAKWHGHILTDAPCSGLGVLARRPDLKNNFGKIALPDFHKNQRKILEQNIRLLSAGCELAFITCTLNPAENENLTDTICRQNPQLTLVRQWQTPHNHPWLEGMFGAVWRKTRA